jgi:rhomboid protease GluP
MIELYRNLTREQADICSLVLRSSGIYHRTKKWKDGWYVWVRSTDFTVALTRMSDYFEENQQVEFEETSGKDKRPTTYTGIWIALVLMAFYLALGEDRKALHHLFGSSAAHILDGAVYRTVTSLMLHVDAVHLVGNMASIALFGSLVCGIHGLGLGWLMILLTGILGNLSNAFLYQTNHVAVGASTAIFGAIGILSAYQFWKKMDIPGERVKAWLPLGGGVALLAFLGSGGGRVDVTAHLFGFVSGLVLETIHSLWIQKNVSKTGQAVCLSVTTGILVISWVWPLWMGGR